MQDLQLIGVHADGEHLLLAGADGARFRVRVDEPLRSVVRRERPGLGQPGAETDGGLRPRDVQSMIRGGASTEDAAERAGWTVEKVRRYEGPIIAEREHVARLARAVHLRGRGGASGGAPAPTLSARVGERLTGRGVNQAGASWDAWRSEDGPWTVVLTFPAGGRQRQASWHFDAADRTVTAIDDEARWLSEDEQPSAGPIPAPHLASAPSGATKVYTVESTVYDVEAEGGLRPFPHAGQSEHAEEPVDLMTAMRERTTARGRRKTGGRRVSRQAPTNVPGAGEQTPDDALPLEDLVFDPETMAPPPAAHGEPDPDGADGRPEPEAAPFLAEVDAGVDAGVDAAVDAESPVQVGPATEAEVDGRTEPDPPAESSPAQPSPAQPSPAQPSPAQSPPAPRARTRRRSSRPSVPAWDDIMFGAKPGTDR